MAMERLSFVSQSLLPLSNRISQAGHVARDDISWLVFSLVMRLSSVQCIWDVSRCEMCNFQVISLKGSHLLPFPIHCPPSQGLVCVGV